MGEPLNDDELQTLYSWVDTVPLSRPKRNINRDFSDGVLLAEIVHHFFPRLVSVHNYESSNAVSSKLYNLRTLQAKVFKRLRFVVDEAELEAVSASTPGAIERLLFRLRKAIEQFQARRRSGSRPRSGGRAAVGASPPPSVPDSLRSRQRAAGHRRVSPQSQVAAIGAWAGAGGGGGRGAYPLAAHAELRAGVEEDLLLEKEKTIRDLRETVETLEMKVEKMSQLLRLKNAMVDQLRQKLDENIA